MQWKIREAKPEDFDAINELVGQLYSIHAKNRPDIYRPCDKPLDYDYYISLLDDDNVKVFIGEEGCLCRTKIHRIRPYLCVRRVQREKYRKQVYRLY